MSATWTASAGVGAAVSAVESAIAALRTSWCARCGARSDRWPTGARCCTRFGTYRGRHRQAARS